jgi:DNA-binding MarR family transcriptional regulator
MMENVNYLINRMLTARQVFLNTRLKELRLSSSLFSFLVEIIQEENLSQKELSRRLQVDPALATRNIRKLTALGYVEKDADPSDRRLNYIRLTPRGREISKQVMELNLDWYRILSSGLDAQEFERTVNSLKKIIINVETAVLGESLIPSGPVKLPGPMEGKI